MDHIKNTFDINDLAHLSGVKAHTIRVWEKRYELLNPSRSETNIREYSIDDLKKILNVVMLNEHGWKISKIAKLNEGEVKEEIDNLIGTTGNFKALIVELKLSMLAYDEDRFCDLLDPYFEEYKSQFIFKEIIGPFLHEIGLLWQNDHICPAHEHFVSNLIRQKLFALLDKLPKPDGKEEVHILYLPHGEVHEFRLLLTHLQLREAGKKSIYLGQGLGLDHLQQVFQAMDYQKFHFISFFTTPLPEGIAKNYLSEIKERFDEKCCNFHLGGKQLKELEIESSDLIHINNISYTLV